MRGQKMPSSNLVNAKNAKNKIEDEIDVIRDKENYNIENLP
jgi:hypothetical protein